MKWAAGFSGWFLPAVWLFFSIWRPLKRLKTTVIPPKIQFLFIMWSVTSGALFWRLTARRASVLSVPVITFPHTTQAQLTGDQISIPPLAERTWWYIAPWLQLICSQLICSLINPAEDKRWPLCSRYLFKLQSRIDPANVALRSPAEKETMAQNALQSLQVCGLLA